MKLGAVTEVPRDSGHPPLISSAPTGSPYRTARLLVGAEAMIRQAVTA
jgi:hypothetical protein